MGNVKVYTFRCPLLPTERLITRQELADAGRSSLAIVDVAGNGVDSVVMGMVESSSMNADRVIDFIRQQYPRRWCVITRFDADDHEFRVISWNSPRDLEPEVRIADSWRDPSEGTCDWHPEHDLERDAPRGRRCGAVATHRLEWLDGSRRYSLACSDHLERDPEAPPCRIVALRIRKKAASSTGGGTK